MSPELTALIERARNHVSTPEQRFESRVSFIYGMLPATDPRTKDDIRRSLIEHEGAPGCICPAGAEKTCQGPLCPRKPIGRAT